MLGCQIQGYKRACAPTTGGVGLLLIADANDFNFTKGSPDSDGEETGYATVERRGGSGATATANLGSDDVDTITVDTPGTGYLEAPAVIITAVGPGSGATAVATIDGSGTVTGITVTNGGTGYTSAPTVTLGDTANMLFFEIDSVGDSIGVEVNQSNSEGSSSAWEYAITAQMAQWKQQLTNFNKKLDAAAACCQIVIIWQGNDETIFVAGEKYVDGVKIAPFRLRQDGSKISTGKKFTDFNGQDLSIKGTYSRPANEFTGGMGSLDTFIAQ